MSGYGPYMDHNLGQIGPELALASTVIGIAAPSLMKVFGGGGGGDSVDPAGAQRQQVFQQKIAQQAETTAAQAAAVQQAILAKQQAAASKSKWTKILIYGGLGLIVLGAAGVLGYKIIKHRRAP